MPCHFSFSGVFVYFQFTAFRAAKQAYTQKGTCPAASAGDDPVSVGYLSFQLFQQNPVYNISARSVAATVSAVLFYCNIWQSFSVFFMHLIQQPLDYGISSALFPHCKVVYQFSSFRNSPVCVCKCLYTSAQIKFRSSIDIRLPQRYNDTKIIFTG